MNCSRLAGVVIGVVLTASMAQGAEQKIAAAYRDPVSIAHQSLRFKLMPELQSKIIRQGEIDALARLGRYHAPLNPSSTSINRTLLSGLAYATASIVANKILTHLTDKQWIKETFFYDQEVLGKKKKLLAITRERTIHEDNIKTLTARVPLAIDDAGLSAKLKELITQEIAKDCDAQKRQDTCKTEYNKLKTTKLGKK